MLLLKDLLLRYAWYTSTGGKVKKVNMFAPFFDIFESTPQTS
jgi:hypothetical protein